MKLNVKQFFIIREELHPIMKRHLRKQKLMICVIL